MDRSYHLGLTGYPLRHSLSPELHRDAMQQLEIPGEYSLYPIAPGDTDALAALIARMCSGEIDGLNVTIPHKQTVIPLLDGLTPLARAVGAVNTIFREGDRLLGDNTDVPGFLADLDRFLGPGPRVGQALVLGAGGAARAVVFGLQQRGWQVTVAARRLESAWSLASSLARTAFALPLGDRVVSQLTPAPDLVVNATPLGMSPAEEGCPWPEDVPLPANAAVYDLVYNPPETVLTRRAKAAGLAATTGLGMLRAQASLAFERWTGYPFPEENYEGVLTAQAPSKHP